MQVGATGKHCSFESVSYDARIFGLVELVDLFLANIRWIAHDSIQWRQHHRDLLTRGVLGDLAERRVYFYIEEVLSIDTRIVGFVVYFAGGEVESRKMGRIKSDIAPEKFAQHGDM